MTELVFIERANAHELLESLSTISPQLLHEKFTLALQRKLAVDASAISDGTEDGDRLERFFDTILQVEPLPPVPYTGEEMAAFATKIATYIEKRDVEIAAEDKAAGEEPNDYSDAPDYHKLAELFPTDFGAAIKHHDSLDTYAREWMFATGFGIDDRRMSVTLSSSN